MVAIRHARFNAALVAAMLYNANRGADSEGVEVWDFLPGYERDPEEVERDKKERSIRQGIRAAFANMPSVTVEKARAEAGLMVERLQANGTENAEQIVREVYEEVIQQPWGTATTDNPS